MPRKFTDRRRGAARGGRGGGGNNKRPRVSSSPGQSASFATSAAAAAASSAVPATSPSSILNRNLCDIFRCCTSEIYRERLRNLDSAEESGVIELRLWPYFLRLAAAVDEDVNADNDGHQDANSSFPATDAALLLCLLVNRRSASGSASGGGGGGGSSASSIPGGSAALSFVASTAGDGDIYADILAHLSVDQVITVQSGAFMLLTTKLLERFESTSKNECGIESDLNGQTEVVHFLVNAFASLDLRPTPVSNTAGKFSKRSPPILSDTLSKITSIGLWESMPERYRDLELRKSAMLRRRWGAWKKSIEHDNDQSSDRNQMILVGYLPRLVATIFRLIDENSIWGGEHVMQLNESEVKQLKTTQAGLDRNDANENKEGDPARRDSCSTLSRQEASAAKSVGFVMDFLNRSLELLTDLLLLPPARRHIRPYLLSQNFGVRLSLSHPYLPPTSLSPAGCLFRQLHSMLVETFNFGYDEATSRSLADEEVASRLHGRAHVLQKLCHRHYPNEATDIIYAGVGRVCNTNFLEKNLRVLDLEVLRDLCRRLRLVDDSDEALASSYGNDARLRSYLTCVVLHHHTYSATEATTLSSIPLYPDESLLWNPHLVPPGNVGRNTSPILALPKLNVSFLTSADYLLRSFKLLRLESAYGIRSDLVDVIKRMRPTVKRGYDDMEYGDQSSGLTLSKTGFQGWARMGLELLEPVRLLKVSPPKLGQTIPAEVLAEVTIDLKHCGEQIRSEWDSIGEFDNLFLLSIDATRMSGEPAPLMESCTNHRGGISSERRISDEEDITFPRRFGVTAVRGCMVTEVRDEKGTILTDPALKWGLAQAEGKRGQGETKGPRGTKRILRVSLDSAQYALDATGQGSPSKTGVYDILNLVVRRHGRENNFKAVLETIRSLLEGTGSVHRSIPSWLQPVLLGIGDPASALYESKSMRDFARKTAGVTAPDAALDYGDTFLDENHLKESFPGCKVEVDRSNTSTRKRYKVKVISNGESRLVQADCYPHPPNLPGNPVHFTPRQVEAIRSGLSPGLTVIVGPPGTGKTDVAVQIIANLYRSFPTQRTVIVTHSNAALNDIFQKVMDRGDVDERYLLRLGSGEKDLKTSSEHDFTKAGRVAHILSRRACLLERVQLISESLGVSGPSERGPDGSPSYTCETAEYFCLHHVMKRIQIFYKAATSTKETQDFSQDFPFKKYFEIESGTASSILSLRDAKKRFSDLEAIFAELAEYRPLELLRTQRQRTDYLLTKQAKIVAMTCTHAAIARSRLVELGFQYDNIIMEEAGQMLDVETVIPLLLQRGESDAAPSSSTRLKRVCLIGDHHQLPPVVKNMSFSKFSHLDQSLFSRLIRHGVPSIDLNRQGRARADIARLYSWRYRDLGDLEHVVSRSDFMLANTGFAHTYQMINVEDFEGRGESTPTAFFYQNLGEAEYVVALFQFMVLIGIPAEKISILTTYNGQKAVLEDIVSQRCGPGTPLAGVKPGTISTVDHYQGQQNDYVLLSLVRTNAVGHLRDVRRLVVAVSRARLGLYIFCRKAIFETCHELRRTMCQLGQRPDRLELVTGEQYPTKRKIGDAVPDKRKYAVQNLTALGSIVHSMQEELLFCEGKIVSKPDVGDVETSSSY